MALRLRRAKGSSSTTRMRAPWSARRMKMGSPSMSDLERVIGTDARILKSETSLTLYHAIHIGPLALLPGEGAGLDVQAAPPVHLEAGMEGDDAGLVFRAALLFADDLKCHAAHGPAVLGQFLPVLLAAAGFQPGVD